MQLNYLDIVSNQAQFLSNKIKFLSFQSIKEKFINYILELAKACGSDEVILPKSQVGLVELFGVARPSLGRVISELNEEGHIVAQGKKITIPDKNRILGLLIR